MKKWIVTAVLALVTSSASAEIFELRVKPGALNRVTFSAPFSEVVISPQAPLSSDPTPIGNDKTMVMQVNENANRPFQIIVQLVNGSILELQMIPDSSAPPLAWTQVMDYDPTAPDSPARVPIQRPEDKWIQDIFYNIVQGQRPRGFSRIEPPSGGQIGSMSAHYIAAFRNQNYVLLVLSLHSQNPQWIVPQDLYAPGVKAVLIDGDKVGGPDAPVAYVLMTAE